MEFTAFAIPSAPCGIDLLARATVELIGSSNQVIRYSNAKGWTKGGEELKSWSDVKGIDGISFVLGEVGDTVRFDWSFWKVTWTNAVTVKLTNNEGVSRRVYPWEVNPVVKRWRVSVERIETRACEVEVMAATIQEAQEKAMQTANQGKFGDPGVKFSVASKQCIS